MAASIRNLTNRRKYFGRIALVVMMMIGMMAAVYTSRFNVNPTQGQGDPTATPDRTERFVVIADGDVTALRQAIVDANSQPGLDTIQLAENGTYTITEEDTLGSGNAFAVISDDVVIDGNGSALYIDENAPDMRFYQIASNTVVTIQNISLMGGHGIGEGGAILNTGDTVLNNVQFRTNATDEELGLGGAIYNSEFAVVDIQGSTFVNNSARYGGAIYNDGDVTISDVVITDSNVLLIGEVFLDTGAIHNGLDATLSIDSGCLTYNFGYAIHNESQNPLLDATNNWWGSPSGPQTSASGHGEFVGGNVEVDPFLSAPPQDHPMCSIIDPRDVITDPQKVEDDLWRYIILAEAYGSAFVRNNIGTLLFWDSQDRVNVIIRKDPTSNNAPLIASIEAAGGRLVHKNSTRQLDVYLPLEMINSIALQPDVVMVRHARSVPMSETTPANSPTPTSTGYGTGNCISEGVELSNASN